jgi:hypothetical protein
MKDIIMDLLLVVLLTLGVFQCSAYHAGKIDTIITQRIVEGMVNRGK